ncbi:hypothetical protein HYPSUDRAFT_212924 [Hypholoma sublateritium FD-334 SS-4]|uniref:Uncharacterized protein n=1 Tax=Hypholoma sublateritium (strain FD-334 SS-4) TaxID=945553 RepID=A0A0D2PDZ3_HYPSF|nr:hypothetical protein HYPSUDRAFT_212924 [Hypholoma sublateritium FD-334 SS-4]
MATLQNKTVVVVGGSSGIGFGVTLAALQSLASVVIIASSNAERVAGAVAQLQAHKLPGEVRGEVVDARDAAAPSPTLRGPAATWRRDTWAAISRSRAFTTRFWGPYILAQSAKFNPGGSLTLTSGILDLKPRPGMTLPAGVSAAVAGLTSGLAVDLAPVRVNVVSPGGVNTEVWDKLQIPDEAKEHIIQEMANKLLIKRIGEPSDLAEAYIFLMKCGYITGQRINVDGGATLV